MAGSRAARHVVCLAALVCSVAGADMKERFCATAAFHENPLGPDLQAPAGGETYQDPYHGYYSMRRPNGADAGTCPNSANTDHDLQLSPTITFFYRVDNSRADLVGAEQSLVTWYSALAVLRVAAVVVSKDGHFKIKISLAGGLVTDAATEFDVGNNALHSGFVWNYMSIYVASSEIVVMTAGLTKQLTYSTPGVSGMYLGVGCTYNVGGNLLAGGSAILDIQVYGSPKPCASGVFYNNECYELVDPASCADPAVLRGNAYPLDDIFYSTFDLSQSYRIGVDYTAPKWMMGGAELDPTWPVWCGDSKHDLLGGAGDYYAKSKPGASAGVQPSQSGSRPCGGYDYSKGPGLIALSCSGLKMLCKTRVGTTPDPPVQGTTPPPPPPPASPTDAPPTPAPQTPAPGTPSPSTPAPATPAPATPVPSTPAPDTGAPPTPSPPTPAPVTPAPLTPAPSTPSPPTPAPLTPAPSTPAPGTPAPSTPSPPTPAPVTPSPVTPTPPTPAPLTPAPSTPSPATPAPLTPAPVTPAPPTLAPPTPAPSTPAPGTPAPPTPAPVTPAPATPLPLTPVPPTPSPATLAPLTLAPPTVAPATPSPLTPVPPTPSPLTPLPPTLAPPTPAPGTPAPQTPVPLTPAPETPTPPTPAPPTVTPPTPSPPTPLPLTTAPATPAPSTPSPPTLSPPTPAPVTPAPVTPAPLTVAPPTPAPSTPAPATQAPLTPAPETPAPPTMSPATVAPLTPAPPTTAPLTPAPLSQAPATAVPPTAAPDTPAPPTPEPLTPAPLTQAPPTPAPPTGAPPTPAPPTPSPPTPFPGIPPTPAPPTPVPPTDAPQTPAPPTPAPPTLAPLTPAPPTPSPPTPATPTAAPPTLAPLTPAPPTPSPPTPATPTAAPLTLAPTPTWAPATPPTLSPAVIPTLAPPTLSPAVPPTVIPETPSGATGVPSGATAVPPAGLTAAPPSTPTLAPDTVAPAAASTAPEPNTTAGVGAAEKEYTPSSLATGALMDTVLSLGSAVSTRPPQASLLTKFECRVEDVDLDHIEPLDWEFHPLQFPVGNHPHKYFLGAVLGNLLILIAFVIFNYLAAALQVAAGVPFGTALFYARAPGLVYIPLVWLLTGTSMSASNMAFFPGRAPVGVALVGWSMMLLCLSVPVLLWVTLLRRRRFHATTVPDPKLSPAGNEVVSNGSADGTTPDGSTEKMVETEPPLVGWRRSLYILAYGRCLWVRTDLGHEYFVEQWGMFFESYREGFHWWSIPDMLQVLLVAFFSAWRTDHYPTCMVRNSLLLLGLGGYFAALLILRPFNARLDQIVSSALSGMLFIAVLFMTIAIGMRGSPESATSALSDVAAVLLLVSAFAMLVKGIYDITLYIIDVKLSRRKSTLGAKHDPSLSSEAAGASWVQGRNPCSPSVELEASYSGSDLVESSPTPSPTAEQRRIHSMTVRMPERDMLDSSVYSGYGPQDSRALLGSRGGSSVMFTHGRRAGSPGGVDSISQMLEEARRSKARSASSHSVGRGANNSNNPSTDRLMDSDFLERSLPRGGTRFGSGRASNAPGNRSSAGTQQGHLWV